MKIENIGLIASSRCNLRCSYCFLCKMNYSNIMDDQIIEAIKNGEYLNNCLRMLDKMGESPKTIRSLEFWGGEPTLNLSLWGQYIKDWGKYFRNVHSLQFITNGTFNAKEMLNFIFQAQEAFPNLFDIDLQVSIDGPGDITQKYRGIDPEKIINNIKELTRLLNKQKVKTKIGVCFKSTLDIDVYNEIHKTPKAATEYYLWWAKIAHDIEEECYNDCFKGVRVSFPIFSMLYDYTQEQGINYANSLISYNAVDWDYIKYTYPTKENLKDCVDMLATISEYYGENYITKPGYYCGAFTNSLLIRHDGSVIGCLAGLYNDSIEYNKELAAKNNTEELEITQRIPKNFYLDLNKSEKEIKDFRKHMDNIRNSLSTNLAIGSAIANELAECGQIENIYKDNPELLIKHIAWLQGKTLCYFNSLRKNGIIYASIPGLYRLYLNGFMSKAEDILAKRKKEKIKQEKKEQ